MTFKPHDYQLEAYRALLKLVDNKDDTFTPTGRLRSILLDTECSFERMNRMALFAAHYGMHRVHDSLHYFPTEMNTADLERRMIATGGMTRSYDGKLCRGEQGTLNGVVSVHDNYYLPTSVVSDVDYTPPPKDFAKARTKKEKLDARLQHTNKSKPSGLLAKLVAKK